jgi:hypothetical protein
MLMAISGKGEAKAKGAAGPVTFGLPRSTDILSARRHVSKVPDYDILHFASPVLGT